ncbi:MAG: zinc-dependent metalloprotease [Ferruginibacter sp.]
MQKYIFTLFFLTFWATTTLIAQNEPTYSPLASEVLALQSAEKSFLAFAPFENVEEKYDAELKGKYQQLTLKSEILGQMLAKNAAAVEIEIPINTSKTIHLQLIAKKLFTDDVVIEAGDKSENKVLSLPYALYYQGIVKENPLQSLASISIFENEINGVFVYEGKTYNVGKLQNNAPKTAYCLYQTKDLVFPVTKTCATQENEILANSPNDIELSPNGANSCVRMYYECDYQFYIKKNSNTTDVVNYVASLFNVVNTLYNNESVPTAISKIFVWTKADGYGSATLNDALEDFGAAKQNNFNGNLAHLISGYSNGLGGLAWVNVICATYSANLNSGPYAVSRLLGSFSAYPAYSWDVEVITHETGHNMSSRHTHWCGWVGGALDNCYTTEGGCAAGPAPTNGGTIMSYCHIISTGINFANGFGTQPGNAIRNAVNNAACLTSCLTTCATNLTISTNITTTAVTKYEASGIIAATNLLSSGTNVTYDAGQEIILQPGFIATSGSNFITVLDGCDNLRESAEITSNQNISATFFQVTIYPNPVTDAFYVTYTLTQTENIEISLWDMMGKKVSVLFPSQTQTAGEYYHTFSLDKLPSGMYLIKVGNTQKMEVLKLWKP